jgi:hypothetical protein
LPACSPALTGNGRPDQMSVVPFAQDLYGRYPIQAEKEAI